MGPNPIWGEEGVQRVVQSHSHWNEQRNRMGYHKKKYEICWQQGYNKQISLRQISLFMYFIYDVMYYNIN